MGNEPTNANDEEFNVLCGVLAKNLAAVIYHGWALRKEVPIINTAISWANDFTDTPHSLPQWDRDGKSLRRTVPKGKIDC